MAANTVFVPYRSTQNNDRKLHKNEKSYNSKYTEIKVRQCNTEISIEHARHDTAQQESHIPDLIAVKAALRRKAAEERKAFLSESADTRTHTQTSFFKPHNYHGQMADNALKK